MLDKVMAEQVEAGQQRQVAAEAIADIHTKLESLSVDQVEICQLRDTLHASFRALSAEHEQILREGMDGLQKGHADLEHRLQELVDICEPFRSPAHKPRVHQQQLQAGHFCESGAGD